MVALDTGVFRIGPIHVYTIVNITVHAQQQAARMLQVVALDSCSIYGLARKYVGVC